MENNPKYPVYHVTELPQEEGEEKRDVLRKVGTAFPFKQGKGFVLLTVYGRLLLVLREPQEVEPEQAPAEELEAAPVAA